ncbi:MAG TPA: class I SAM-dependent methyltransferase [Thermomicrobiales bacterium]|nr:class I SAM-dependent methyltransferase [Thermomicrobiales bacterium]
MERESVRAWGGEDARGDAPAAEAAAKGASRRHEVHAQRAPGGLGRGLSPQPAEAGFAASRSEPVAAVSTAGAGATAAALEDTRRAFDGVAAEYDGPLGNNALIRRMRARVRRELIATFPPGARLLDLGCGTGLDAAYLAARGYRVVATDWSPGMVARTRERAAAQGLEGAIDARVVGGHELDRLAGERFDGIYSNLGPLNCVPDLAATARACARLLAPGGRLVASVIGRVCPWEFAYYTARGDWARARLRRARGAVPVGLNGATVWTRYYTPREFAAAFAGGFAPTRYRALGLFTPPPYLVGIERRARPLVAALDRLDDRLGALPLLRDAGDHFLIVLTRRD